MQIAQILQGDLGRKSRWKKSCVVVSPFHTAPGMGALLHAGWLLTAVVPLGAPPDSWKQKRLPHMEQAFPIAVLNDYCYTENGHFKE